MPALEPLELCVAGTDPNRCAYGPPPCGEECQVAKARRDQAVRAQAEAGTSDPSE